MPTGTTYRNQEKLLNLNGNYYCQQIEHASLCLIQRVDDGKGEVPTRNYSSDPGKWLDDWRSCWRLD
jgi:hypothetical protein